MRHAVPVLASLTLLSACVPQPRQSPPALPPPPVLAAPVPALGPDWRDWPLTPGTWTYRRDARGSIAAFGPAGADALMTLRCDPTARIMYLSRRGNLALRLTVRTSSVTRTLAVQPTGGAVYVTVALAPGDALLDAMGFSRGRFTIEQAGLVPLVVPAWAEIERVTEDCRG